MELIPELGVGVFVLLFLFLGQGQNGKNIYPEAEEPAEDE